MILACIDGGLVCGPILLGVGAVAGTATLVGMVVKACKGETCQGECETPEPSE